ncbi:unnamed protein product, partial [Tilletia laevis]
MFSLALLLMARPRNDNGDEGDAVDDADSAGGEANGPEGPDGGGGDWKIEPGATFDKPS